MARNAFVLGQGTHGALRVPIDVVTQTVAILARKDGGKTYTAMLMAEKLLDAGAQVLVIESVGKYWALRVGKDGRSRGKNIAVLGGKHGDVPLSPEAGKLVAKALVEGRISAVLDLTFMRKGQRRRFLADFGEELLHLKQLQEPATPLHLFVEEAQQVIPQMTRAGGPEENRMLGAFEDIVRVGRNAAIGVTMISQRPQSVNKEALSQTELLIALGVNEVPARKAIELWVQEKGTNREIIGDLPGLERGEAIVWSPSWLRFFGRVKIAQRETYDSTATARLGRRRAVGKIPKYRKKELEAAFHEATKLADDPTSLRRRIAELEKVKVPKVVVKETTRVVLPKRAIRRIEKAAKTFERAAVRAQAAVKEIVVATGGIDGLYKTLQASANIVHAALAPASTPAAPPKVTPPKTPRYVPTPTPPATPSSEPRQSVEGLNGYAMELVRTMAQRHPTQLTTSQIAILSGRSPKSSAFSGAMASIKKAGLVTESTRGRYVLTEEGKSKAGAVEAPRRGAALREHWLQVLDDYPSVLFRAAVSVYPNTLSRERLSELTGKSLKSSAFSGAISTLVKNELFEVPAPGELKVAPTLFED